MNRQRKCSNIDRLPPQIRDTAEEMMRDPANTYKDIAEYIKSKGFKTSVSGVARHAANLNETAATLKMAQENFRVIMEEINKYPNLDTTEGIIRLLSNHVIEAINATPQESWKGLDPLKLIQQATALTRAAAYKNKIDVSNKDMYDKGLDYIKGLVFEAMSKEKPELYKEVSEYLKSKEESECT